MLRNTDPGIHWHDEPDGTGFWSVTRIDHLREVNRNTDVFSSNAGGTQIVDPPPGDIGRGQPRRPHARHGSAEAHALPQARQPRLHARA